MVWKFCKRHPRPQEREGGIIMGDYTKLIIHAEVRIKEEELKTKIEELGLCDSAYHCGGIVKDIYKDPYYFNKISDQPDILYLTLIGQTKYSRGQSKFIDWLTPYVVRGSGPASIWAMQFSEYSDMPHFISKRKISKELLSEWPKGEV